MANDAVYEVNIKLNAQNFEAELDALKKKFANDPNAYFGTK